MLYLCEWYDEDWQVADSRYDETGDDKSRT